MSSPGKARWHKGGCNYLLHPAQLLLYGEGPLIHRREKHREISKDCLARRQKGAVWPHAVGLVHCPVRGDKVLRWHCLTNTWPCNGTSFLLPLARGSSLKTAEGMSIRELRHPSLVILLLDLRGCREMVGCLVPCGHCQGRVLGLGLVMVGRGSGSGMCL